MLLRVTNSRAPATDLGFLLHKHPDRVQAFGLPFGKAHVFYPEVADDRCTAILLLDVDPVALVRKRGLLVRRNPFWTSHLMRPSRITQAPAPVALRVSGSCYPWSRLRASHYGLSLALAFRGRRGGQPA